MANGAWANGVFIQAALMGVEFADRLEPLPRHPFYDFYTTKDNREFALGLINATREWPKLAKAINRTDLLTDPRFEGDNLIENAKELKVELQSKFSKMTLDEINKLLRPSGVTYGVLGKTTDHEKDPQFLDTETLVPLEHESFSELLTINSPFQIDGEDKISFKRAPHIGENTSEILSEMGVDEETQKTLMEKGVIA
jgi:formyl-CoA transferase